MKMRSGLAGEEHMVAEFKLQAKFVGGDVTWSFIFDGREYGNVKCSYNE